MQTKLLNLTIILVVLSLFTFSNSIKAQDAKSLYLSAKSALENGNTDECLAYIKSCQSILGGSNAKLESIKCQALIEKGDWVNAGIAYNNFERLIPVSAKSGEAYQLMKENGQLIWSELEKIEKAKKEKIEKEISKDLEEAIESEAKDDKELNRKQKEINERNEKELYQMAIETKDIDLLNLYKEKIGNAGENFAKIESEIDKNKNPNKYIASAVNAGNVKELEYLLSLGANINTKDANQQPLIHLAIINKNKEILAILIDSGANIEAVNYLGETALLLAIKKGYYNGTAHLLKHNANAKAINIEGKSAMYYCLLYNEIAATELLISKGIDINEKLDVSGEKFTPLYYAVYISKNPLMTGKLLSLGANPNEYNHTNWTPLMAAIYTNEIELVRILIRYKADINIKGPYNWTALHFASRQRNAELIQLLLSNGAEARARDIWNRTPKGVAREHDFDEIVKVFKSYK